MRCTSRGHVATSTGKGLCCRLDWSRAHPDCRGLTDGQCTGGNARGRVTAALCSWHSRRQDARQSDGLVLLWAWQ